MSVTIRPYRNGGWEVDIRVVTPDGTRQLRERKRSPISSRSAALRWAEGRERTLFERLMDPAKHTPRKEVPTLRAFAPRFLDGHSRANRQKPSGIAAKEMILRVHLLPALGHRRLDTIKNEDVQRLKSNLQAKSPKTVNNVLAVLSVLLKKAVEWEVIERMPCSVKLLPVPKGSTAFYDFDEYERLVEAARAHDPRTLLIVLLGGEAGLRCGEMIALEWADVDLVNRQVCVRRSDWNGQVTTPKGGRLRHVPLTRRLAAALAEHRHLRSARVLLQDDGQPLTRQIVQTRAKRAARRAGLAEGMKPGLGGVHILRHSFCSHLAMRGGAGAGDSGAGRAQGSGDDPALHAPEPGGAGRGDSVVGGAGGKAAGRAWRAGFWRRGGDGPRRRKTINKSGGKTGGEAGIRTLKTRLRR
ncbi:MAG: tyrosine-type recombinase/integrase [Vicinamibacterales bacterium]